MSTVGKAYLTVQCGSALARVPYASVRYLESRRHYLIVHALCGTFRVRGRISEYAGRLAGEGFVQTHRCYVVNASHIASWRRAEVELVDGIRIPVGRRFRAKLTTVG